MIHVAILKPRYCRAILDGGKTIESRFSKTRRDPFGKVLVGECIYIKRVSGAIVARARVGRVEYFEDLDVVRVEALREEHGHAIGGDDAYWERVRGCRYGTLVWLEEVEAVDEGPDLTLFVSRGSRAAWLVLPESAADTIRSSLPRLFSTT